MNRPILFKGDMVRAILEGRKTMTRRVQGLEDVNSVPGSWDRVNVGPLGYYAKKSVQGKFGATFMSYPDALEKGVIHICPTLCPFGVPGDRLWVKETWADLRPYNGIAYKADTERGIVTKWSPSIHMPRWASRITLEITDVRVERLQAITEEDARAGGIADGGCLNCGEHEPCGCNNPQPDARDTFARLWDSIYKKYPWQSNPYVWVIEFKRA